MKSNTFLFMPVLVLAALSSCSTLSDKKVASLAGGVSEQISAGNFEALSEISGTPFLFETEILSSPAQLELLWRELGDSGYDFRPQGEILILDVDSDTVSRFSSSREVLLWFERQAPRNVAVAVFPSKDGDILILIDRNRKSRTALWGLKVHQQ